jgi:hypothetical protein
MNDADVDKEIISITTDFDADFTAKLQNVVRKHKTVCKPHEDLPPLRPGLDHEIPLVDNAEVPKGRIYRLSPAELDELKKQLQSLLAKNFIKESFSPFAAPVLFARKANGGLRMCVDYRQLNKYTKKVNFPIPHADMLLDMLSGAAVYTALDLALGYHQLRIKPEDTHKTSMNTQFGQWEFLVLPFGLSSAPSSFQRLMNHILKPHVNTFVLVYLDDVLIFSKSTHEHLTHLDTVLQLLEDNDIRLRLQKCWFARKELEYLGHMVSGSGIRPSDSKIKAVTEWPVPHNVQQIQSFLGFCNFYRRYVKDYSKIANPLYAVTHKNAKFQWTDTQSTAFQQLKRALCTAPVLMCPTT